MQLGLSLNVTSRVVVKITLDACSSAFCVTVVIPACELQISCSFVVVFAFRLGALLFVKLPS
jgi:hypothetical protein